MGASPHHTCGCSHILLEYPRKNKTAELHLSQLLSPEEVTSALCMGDGVEGGEVEIPSS